MQRKRLLFAAAIAAAAAIGPANPGLGRGRRAAGQEPRPDDHRRRGRRVRVAREGQNGSNLGGFDEAISLHRGVSSFQTDVNTGLNRVRVSAEQIDVAGNGGDGGSDTVDGGDGADQLFGGAGFDRISGGLGAGFLSCGGAPRDLLFSEPADTISADCG